MRNRLISMIKGLLSFECLFILFLFAGRYKARFQWFPVDLTAFFFILSFSVGFWILLKRGFRVTRQSFTLVMLGLVFVVYVVASLFWSPGNIYAYQKTLYIVTLTLWPLIASAFIIAYDLQRLKRFLIILTVFSLFFVCDNLLAFLQTDPSLVKRAYIFTEDFHGGYQGIGRVIGLGLVIILWYTCFYIKTLTEKIAATLIIVVYIGLMLIIGARGPLIATCFAVIPILFVGVRLSHGYKIKIVSSLKKWIIIMLIAFIFIGIPIYIFPHDAIKEQTVTISRILKLFGDEVSDRQLSRIVLYSYAVQFWMNSPLIGNGIGSFPILIGIGDVSGHPHNIILEILVELGLVGLMFFCLFLGFALNKLTNNSLQSLRKNPMRLIILILFINVLINAMVSGDISDNRIIFGIVGLMVFNENGAKKNKVMPACYQ